MKKLLILFAILLVIVAAAVTVAPEFIDWNAYRGTLAAQIERQTGRKVTFGGDLGVTLLPTPALVAKDVRLSNIEGGESPQMLSLRTLELRIAAAPLLTGRLHFPSMRLVEPVLSLEVASDGRRNWDFGTPEAVRSEPSSGQPGGEDDGSAVRFDNVVVENGTVLYRDARSGTTARIDGIDAQFGATSLEGPLDGEGTLVYRGVPVQFDVALGQLIQGRTVPLNVVLQLAQARASLSGAILGVGENPRFKGEVKSEGQSLGALVATLSGRPAPAPLAQSFAVEAEVVASTEKLTAERSSIRLGDTRAALRLEVAYADDIDFTVGVDVPRLDLDALLAPPPPPAGKAAPAPGNPAPDGPRALAPNVAAPAAAPDPGPLRLPENVHGVAEVTADAITYRDGIIGQFRASLEMTGNEVVVNQLSAQLPGGSEAAIFGVANLNGGTPRFEGELDLKINDLRRILRWAGVAEPPVDAERLRSLTLRSAQVIVEPHQVQLGNIAARLDTTQITGGIAIAMTARPSFGAALEIDRLNLDAYMPRPAPGDQGSIAQPADQERAPQAPTDLVQPDIVLNPLRTFSAFDCNLRLGIKHLTVRDAPIHDLRLDASLLKGALTVREFSAADMAGAAIAVKGGFDAGPAIPEFKELSLSVRTQDLDRLFRFFDLPTSATARELGAVSTTATLDGRVVAPRLQAALQARDMEVTADGEFAWLPAPGLDLKTRVRHKDVARLVRIFGFEYRPLGPLGGVDASGRVRLTPERITFEEMNGQFGPVRAEGSLALATTGARPKLTADLRTDTLELDKFLPPRRNATLPPRQRAIVPAAYPSAPRPRTQSATPVRTSPDRWSHETLDLSVLHSFDADVKLSSKTLAYGPYRIEQADVTARLAQGMLNLEQLTGRLFGGALAGQATLEAASKPRLAVSLSLKESSLAAGLKALTGAEAAGGSLDLDATVAGSGGSEAQIVASLAGKGAFAMKQIDVRKSGAGAALAPALEILRGLNALGSLVGGASAPADLTGTFAIDTGIARSDDLKLASSAYEATAKADVDLPRWQVRSEGRARLTEAGVDAIPFSVSGPLDAPDVKISPPENLRNFSIRIPDKLLKDKDARRQFLEDLKKGVIGN